MARGQQRLDFNNEYEPLRLELVEGTSCARMGSHTKAEFASCENICPTNVFKHIGVNLIAFRNSISTVCSCNMLFGNVVEPIVEQQFLN